MIVEIINKDRNDLQPRLEPQQGGGPKSLSLKIRVVFTQVSASSEEQLHLHPKDTNRQLNPGKVNETHLSLCRVSERSASDISLKGKQMLLNQAELIK